MNHCKAAALVVDMSQVWEEALLSAERGYDVVTHEDGSQHKATPDFIAKEMKYRYGNVRDGFRAIAKLLEAARARDIAAHSVNLRDEYALGDDRLCDYFRPLVPKANRHWKNEFAAFECDGCDLGWRLQKDDVGTLFVAGYDRDYCLLDTVRSAVDRGYRVVTCEQLMLSVERGRLRDGSLDYYRRRTVFKDALEDVLQLLEEHGR